MKTLFVTLSLILLGFSGASCGNGGDCNLPAQWSAASSGSSCQVNFFGTADHAVYCSENGQGGYDCACGAMAEKPLEFTSEDFCDLGPEARACAAISSCKFPI